MRSLVVGILSLFFWTCNVLAQLLICGSCGSEARVGDTLCAHCGARLPQRAVATANALPGTPAPEQNEAVSLAEADGAAFFVEVKSDVEAARSEEERRPEVALARYENARALLTVLPPEQLPADAMSVVVDGVLRCRALLAATGQTCPACGGSGRKQIMLQQLGGSAVEAQEEQRRTTGQPCPSCDGSGRVRQRRSVESARLLILQGRREAVLQQQALGRVAVGKVWLPPLWLDKLTPAEIAAARKVLAAECSACAGLALETCRSCKGSGSTPCKNRLCKDGWVEETPSNVLTTQSTLKRRVKCPDCHGTAQVACATCHGTGGVACRLCKGSGLAQPCRVCGGSGTVVCTLCRKHKSQVAEGEICPQCKATGKMLCNSCRGDGYQAR